MLGEEDITVMAALPLQPASAVTVAGEITAMASASCKRKEERIPQWGYHETKEFIAIRAELERDFTQTKRNKSLWEVIAGKMKERGFRRTSDQCRCKWKNLVNRYKGKEISEPDNGRQCPFFDEVDSIFREREKHIERLHLESEPGVLEKKLKGVKRLNQKFSDEDSDDEDEDDDDSEDESLIRKKRRKTAKERQRFTGEKYRANSVQELLEDFFQHQQRVEEQWRETIERREQERRGREQQWRDTMEKLEQERLFKEQAWREQEEQRRAREEARAEKRDELFAALLDRLVQDES